MKRFVFGLFLVSVFVISASALCDETRSYNKTWTLQARDREATRAERQEYYKSLTREQLMQVSDYEIYPTLPMTCGMGFSGGLAKIFVAGKAGFIDMKGKIVIKPAFNDVGRFSEN